VIASRQPIRSVLSLVAVMLALSVIFLLLSAQFVFAVQVIIYAGAVMVLFLFVVALLGPVREREGGPLRFQWGLGVLVALLLGGIVYAGVSNLTFRAPDRADLATLGTVQQVGLGLFTRYLFPFELTSILLLTAAVGAIYLSRGSRTGSQTLPRPAGEGGTLPREVGGVPREAGGGGTPVTASEDDRVA
jgi:NADH-quinone oxidoreductase subunit J